MNRVSKEEFLKQLEEWEESQREWWADFKKRKVIINKCIEEYCKTHPDFAKQYNENKKLNDEADQLILEYNRRMKDDINYPNKDKIRIWFSMMSQKFINEGVNSFRFLYPDFIGPIEELEKIYSHN